MSTLVMTVGTGRNRSDIAVALLFGIGKHNPGRVIFFCSHKTRDETMPLIEPELRKKKTPYEVCVFERENDVQHLYQVYLEQLRRYRDIVVDFTSGTKAMSSALFAAAIAVEAREVSYITGPRDTTGRVTESTDVSSLSPEQVIAERQLDRAKEFFNHLDFHAAVELSGKYRRSLPRDSSLRAWAKTIWMVATAYDLWDRFMWDQAARCLRKAVNPREGLVKVDLEQLQANAEFISDVESKPRGDERLVELANNARRRIEQGRFDDALARMYRAYEYLVQNCLWNEHKIDTSAIPVADIRKLPLCEETRRKLARKAGNTDNLKISFRDGLELLAELNHPVGKELIGIYWQKPWTPQANFNPKDAGKLQNWLNQRNQSFLAHGTVPAKEDIVKRMLNEYDRILAITVAPDVLNQARVKSNLIKL